MHPLECYLGDLHDIRSTGAAVKETSYYPPLANLLNAVGQTLRPRVRCIINLKNQGAVLPDGGLLRFFFIIYFLDKAIEEGLLYIEGNFDLQVRVQIDCHPSSQSTVKDQPSFVSAGFLLFFPDTSRYTCDRMEYGVSQQGVGTDGYAALKTLDYKEREETWIWFGADSHTALKTLLRKGQQVKEFCDSLDSEWPLEKKADHVYLRLEQRDGWFHFFISPNGGKWTPLLYRSGPPAKLQVGLAAYSTSSKPSKVRFDKLKLTRGKKKER